MSYFDELVDEQKKASKGNATKRTDPIQKKVEGDSYFEELKNEQPIQKSPVNPVKGGASGDWDSPSGSSMSFDKNWNEIKEIEPNAPKPQGFIETAKNEYKRDPFNVGLDPSSLNSIYFDELDPNKNKSFEQITGEITGKYILPLGRDIVAYGTGIGVGGLIGSVAPGVGTFVGGVAGGMSVGAPMGIVSARGKAYTDERLGKDITSEQFGERQALGGFKGMLTGGGAAVISPAEKTATILTKSLALTAPETMLNLGIIKSEGDNITPTSALGAVIEPLATNFGANMLLKGISKIPNIINKSSISEAATGRSTKEIEVMLKTEAGQAELEVSGATKVDIESSKQILRATDEILFDPNLSYQAKAAQIKEKLKANQDRLVPDEVRLKDDTFDQNELKKFMQLTANSEIKADNLKTRGGLSDVEKLFVQSKENVMYNSGEVGQIMFNDINLIRKLHDKGRGFDKYSYDTQVRTHLRTEPQEELYGLLVNRDEATEWSKIIGEYNKTLISPMNSHDIEAVRTATRNSAATLKNIGERMIAVEIKTKPSNNLVIKESLKQPEMNGKNRDYLEKQFEPKTKYEVYNKKTEERIPFKTKQEAQDFIKKASKPTIMQLEKNYFPQVLDLESFKAHGYNDMVESIWKANPGETVNGIRHLILADGKEIPLPNTNKFTKAQIAKKYEDVFRAHDLARQSTQSSKFGNLYYERNYLIPPKYLLNPHQAFYYYASNANEKMAFNAVWGDNNVNLWQNLLPRYAKEVGIHYDGNSATKLIDSALGFAQKVTGISTIDRTTKEILSKVKNINILRTMLFSPLGNATQWFAPIVYGGTPKHTFQFYKSLLLNKEYTQAMLVKAGTNYDIVNRETMNTLTDQLQLWKATDKMLHINGFQLIEKVNRQHAAGYGMFFVDEMINKLNRGKYSITEKGQITKNGKLIESTESDFALRSLKKMDVDPKEVLGQKVGDKWIERRAEGLYFATEQQKLSAMRKAEIDTNFRGYVEKFPEIRDNAYGNLGTQLGTFRYMQTKNIYENVIKELGHGNIKPIIAHLMVNGVSGTAAVELATIIGCGITVAAYKASGRDMDLVNYYRSTSMFQKFMAMKRPEDFLSGIIRAMAKSGGFGFFDFPANFLQYGDPSLGPTIGTATKLAQGSKIIFDEGFNTQKALYQGYPALAAALVPVPGVYVSRGFSLMLEHDNAHISRNGRMFEMKYGSPEGNIQATEKRKETKTKSEEKRTRKLNILRQR
jgi:hypothetical protein